MVRQRSKTYLSSVVLGVVCGLIAPTEAWAGDAEDARSSFVTASRFFQAEEFEAALPLFEKAYELSGHRPATIFGLAQCERSLKHYVEAMAHFREYLATGPSNAEGVKETLGLLKDLIAVRSDAAGKRDADAAAKAQARASAAAQARRVKAEQSAKAAQPRTAPVAQNTETGSTEDSESSEEDNMDSGAAYVAPEVPPLAPVLGAPAASSQPDLTATAPVSAEDEAQQGGVFSSPWFWTVASVVVVGGAVASGVLLTGGSPDDIYGGTTGVVLGN